MINAHHHNNGTNMAGQPSSLPVLIEVSDPASVNYADIKLYPPGSPRYVVAPVLGTFSPGIHIIRAY
jgi:hypothetical protein